MTNRKASKMFRDLGKSYLTIILHQQSVNMVRRDVRRVRKEAEAIARKLSPLLQAMKNV